MHNNFCCEADHFAIEELRLHGPNIIIFHLVAWRQLWHVVRCYISPSNASTIEGLSAEIRDQTYGDELLVVGNLNTNLADPEGIPQAEAIADKLAAA